MNHQLKQAACRYNFGSLIPLRDHRQHDGCPGTHRNDARRESIGQASEPTRSAEETILSGAIVLINAATRRTSPTGVARINGHDGHASLQCLVLDKGSKLEECPVCVSCPLPPTYDELAAAVLAWHHAIPDRRHSTRQLREMAERLVAVREHAKAHIL